MSEYLKTKCKTCGYFGGAHSEACLLKSDLRKLVVEIDRRGFAAVGNAEAQNAWGWCSIEIEKLLEE